jgi:hypothetical protein
MEGSTDANGMPPFIMLRVTLDELNLILEQRSSIVSQGVV